MEKRITNQWGSTLELYDDRVELTHTGLIMFGGARGKKTLFFNDFSSLELKEPGIIMQGYIQFNVPGHVHRVDNPAFDEYSFAFTKKTRHEVAQFYQMILDKKRESQNNSGSAVIQQASSPIDEIKKLKELLDLGIISQEEFNSKKEILMRQI